MEQYTIYVCPTTNHPYVCGCGAGAFNVECAEREIEVAPVAERDEAIRERDELRAANITPEDADRPLGQSVEYWQDRCLDYATALDRARAQLREQRSGR